MVVAFLQQCHANCVDCEAKDCLCCSNAILLTGSGWSYPTLAKMLWNVWLIIEPGTLAVDMDLLALRWQKKKKNVEIIGIYGC